MPVSYIYIYIKKTGTQIILYLVLNKSQFSMTSYNRLKPCFCNCRLVNVLDLLQTSLLTVFLREFIIFLQKLGQFDTKKTKKNTHEMHMTASIHCLTTGG